MSIEDLIATLKKIHLKRGNIEVWAKMDNRDYCPVQGINYDPSHNVMLIITNPDEVE